jgi:predicted RNase H-like HicB family nuclease
MQVVRLEVGVQANLQWAVYHGNGGNWVAVCEPLKLTVQSETWAELMVDIAETLDGVLKELLVSNELDQFLREQGWQIAGAIPVYARARPEDVRFDIPFVPVIAAANGPQRSILQ